MTHLATSARGPRTAIAAAIAVACSALSGCSGGGASAGAESASGDEHPLAGSPAPYFDLAAVGDKPASLPAAKGKVVLVDFWATWCAPCKASFPKWEALSRKHGGEFVVIGVSEDDEKEGIDAFVKETGVTFAIGWDSDKGVASAYKPGTMPTAFLIDKNGLVRYVHSGFRAGDEKLIDAKIKSLLE